MTATPKKTPKRIGGGAMTPGLSESDDILFQRACLPINGLTVY
jgi:hypothetical protein